MSFRVAGVPVIAVERDRRCTACGKVDECRPYGKDGAQVCFGCAMATPESKAEAESARCAPGVSFAARCARRSCAS
jgi:hypothetical protein